MSDDFEVMWQADDGYAGGSRPQHLTISAAALDDDMTEQDARDYLEGAIHDDFIQTVSPITDDENEFIAWVMEQMAKRKAENDEA